MINKQTEQYKQKLSVVIPTYNRGEVLLSTIQLLLDQKILANEIVVVDQTDYQHNDPVLQQLDQWHSQQQIKLVQLQVPSIPNAMNQGLLMASSEYVLFIDDDVEFAESFIEQHLDAINKHCSVGHVGQIIQPWQQPTAVPNYQTKQGLARDLNFPFYSNEKREVDNCMAGNLCVNKALALSCGGFDCQFSGVAYRFETEFARRLIKCAQNPLLFIPSASLNHLKVSSGGTRNHAQSHLTTFSDTHSVGSYYFAFLQTSNGESRRSIVAYVLKRFLGAFVAKFYLKKPWWIPVRLIAECRGLVNAGVKILEGPKHVSSSTQS